jgi:DNA-binding NarL/FixJ family response regulator
VPDGDLRDLGQAPQVAGPRLLSHALSVTCVTAGATSALSHFMSLRLLIADDEDSFAELVDLLARQADRLEVVGRARNGVEAVDLAQELTPDVIVMDIGMPLMDGIEATHRILRADPDAQIVIFTGSDDARDVQRARRAGATAFVEKAHVDAVLLDAIRRAGDRRSRSGRQQPLRSAVAPA